MRTNRQRLEDILNAIEKIEYFRVDLEIVWSTATEDLKRLKPQIEALLNTFPGS